MMTGTVDLTRTELNRLDFKRVCGTQHVAVEVEDVSGAKLQLLVTVEQFDALHQRAKQFHQTAL